MPTSENTDPGRIRSGGERVYGVHMTLPETDPLQLVLGPAWSAYRWYSSEKERDRAFEDLQREHQFSRLGDTPTLHYKKVEREKPPAPMRQTAPGI